MKAVLVIAMLACACPPAGADILYQQLPDPAGGSHVSSWWEPDGSNYDLYLWDAFTPGASAGISTIEWRGTYGASGSPTNFTVAIYASIPAGTQPDFSQPPLVEYETGGNAGETYAGVFGGAAMYDYSFTLPVAFPAQAAVRYWLQIEGWQAGFPDWGIAAGLGGNGSHFRCEHNNLTTGFGGVPTGCWFTTRTGDVAFTLLTNDPIGAEESPGQPGFALGAVFPNPSRGDRLNVTFRLPNAMPTRLALFDVAGRHVASEEVGTRGAGRHVADLARQAPIRPGVYFIRLTRAGQEATTRACVVR